MEKVSIIIPNFNGKELLKENLPSLLKATCDNNEIIVVDDGSTDGSAEFIRSSYPDIKLLRLEKNQGFGTACNHGIKESKNRLIYLLNNDIRVGQNFLQPLLTHFQKDDIFAVRSREVSPDLGAVDFDVLIYADFKFGIFWYRYERTHRLKDAVPTLFADGGHTMFDKEKFLILGGFDALYRPFYWEDWDISYRAWKKGWRTLYAPRSEVFHKSGSTVSKIYSDKYTQSIRWKNHFLFIWKNITSRWLISKHFFFLPFELVVAPFLGEITYTLGFFCALKQLPPAIKKRRLAKKEKYIFSDYDILKQFKTELQRSQKV